MSIEHKSNTAAPSPKSASPVGHANAGEIPHHPIADLFPALPEKELAELAEDIAANGQREPGVVWNGMLLDGKNRRLACKLRNITFKVVTKDFADEHEAIAFSISANLRRRHLDESCQRSPKNRPIEEWGKLLCDVPAATAILDRFLHRAAIVAISGKSYRLKDRAKTKE